MSAKLIRYATILLALFGFATVILVTRLQAEKAMPRLNPPPTYLPDRPFPSSVAATGIIEALGENVAIGVPVPGLVSAMEVKVNDSVKAGDVLFRLDDRELQARKLGADARLSLAESQVRVAQAILDSAHRQYDRIKGMKNPQAVSQDMRDSRLSEVEIADARLQAAAAESRAARAEQESLTLLLEQLVIRAPRDATILQVNLRAGEYAATAPLKPAMIIGNTSRLQVRIDVDEQNATRVQPGAAAVGTLKGDPRVSFPLEFLRIEPHVIPKVSLTGASTERVDTRVLQLIYTLAPEKGAPLYVGQQVDVHIEAPEP